MIEASKSGYFFVVALSEFYIDFLQSRFALQTQFLSKFIKTSLVENQGIFFLRFKDLCTDEKYAGLLLCLLNFGLKILIFGKSSKIGL